MIVATVARELAAWLSSRVPAHMPPELTDLYADREFFPRFSIFSSWPVREEWAAAIQIMIYDDRVCYCGRVHDMREDAPVVAASQNRWDFVIDLADPGFPEEFYQSLEQKLEWMRP